MRGQTMVGSKWPTVFLSIASLASQASASFGFTNPTFSYVKASSPISLAWNGNSGSVSLRILVYPPDEVQSYLPIAANLTGSTYTWMPPNLAEGSQWTLEGVDDSGQIASADQFTVQPSGSDAVSGSASTTSYMQQNPKITATPTTLITSSATSTSTPQATTSISSPTNTGTSAPVSSVSTNNHVGIWIAVACVVAVLAILVAFVILRRRKGGSLNPFNSRKPAPTTAPIVSELEVKEGISRGYLELQGCETPGTQETSMGKRIELG